MFNKKIVKQKSQELFITAVGDIALSRTLQNKYFIDSTDPFFYVRPVLDDCDLSIGNLEFPFSKLGDGYTWESFDGYRVLPPAQSILKNSGLDVLTLANNHIHDWGEEGINTTKAILSKLGIKHTGAGHDISEAQRPIIISKNGFKIGILARTKKSNYTATEQKFGAAPIIFDEVCEKINSLNSLVDILILSLHWGIEFSPYPLPEDINMAHKFIDAGADVILGHHAHVLQGVESYNNGLIFYGLGNFVYDYKGERIVSGEHLDRRQESVMIKLKFINDDHPTYEIIPCRIGDDLRTNILVNQEALNFLKRIEKISQEMKEPNAFYSVAFLNIRKQIIKHYLFYLRRDGFVFIWRFIRQFKIRHIRLLFGYFNSIVSSFFLKVFNSKKG